MAVEVGRRASVLALVALVALSAPARAQSTGDAAAAASELFQQGRRALLELNFDVACPRLAESERLDPKVGTLINLAQCEEGVGRLTQALRRWDEALDLAQQKADRRVDYVVEQRSALAPRVPQLTIRVTDPGGAGLSVAIDDGPMQPLVEPAAPVAVDPGSHRVRLVQPGHVDVVLTVATAEGSSVELPIAPGPLVPVLAPTSTALPSTRSWGGTQRILGYVAGGLGLAGLGAASVFGAQAISARNDPNCHSGVCATPADAQTQRDGVSAGNVSTGLFIAGGALLAGGFVLWLTAPNAVQSQSPAGSGRRSWIGCAPLQSGATARMGFSW